MLFLCPRLFPTPIVSWSKYSVPLSAWASLPGGSLLGLLRRSGSSCQVLYYQSRGLLSSPYHSCDLSTRGFLPDCFSLLWVCKMWESSTNRLPPSLTPFFIFFPSFLLSLLFMDQVHLSLQSLIWSSSSSTPRILYLPFQLWKMPPKALLVGPLQDEEKAHIFCSKQKGLWGFQSHLNHNAAQGSSLCYWWHKN